MSLLLAVQGFLAAIGRGVLGICQVTGSVVLFAASGLSHIFRPPYYPMEVLRQIMRIGYFSLPVVGMKALFNGV